ncbi:MAG: hypothetical protein GQ528_07620 [Woeseiaceae bacterium]|nr:hypothetical protein [Woeseiaceae bacterium]
MDLGLGMSLQAKVAFSPERSRRGSNLTHWEKGDCHGPSALIVTMTTLGFGDMYGNAQSIWGHILLTIQVILGYVLLGALVARFAVLFTAGGPAGKFADEEKDDDGKY